jgi:serine/threonine-protein kinase
MVPKAEIPFGTLIGKRYLIQRVLGQGGLGRTYLAYDTHRFSEPCVLKEFAPSGSGEYHLRKSRDLFEREAKLLHKIHHPQIPKFLACFEEDGRLFLVQDFVNGKTYSALLRERQQRGAAFSEPEIVQWLLHLLPILDYIHERGIIHRDISPDNIMLPDGEPLPVLIDFGVGKQTILPTQTPDEDESSWEQDSFVGKMTFVGKLGYAPREQIAMGRCSPSSDLYSLGVAAIVLLTAKDPTLLVSRGSLEWEWRSFSKTSEELALILDRMLAEQPQQRYQSATEVLTALRSLGGEGETMLSQPPPAANSAVPPTILSPQTPRGTSNPFASKPYPDVTQVSLPPRERASTPRPKQFTSLNPTFIDRCRRELAYAIGPMADLILEEVLSQPFPSSPQELVELLAAEIPDFAKANEFRRRLGA